MTRMYPLRDTVFLGQFILGTKGPRKFLRGHVVSGRPNKPHRINREQERYPLRQKCTLQIFGIFVQNDVRDIHAATVTGTQK